MKKKVISAILYLYFIITFIIFIIENIFEIGKPLFIVGQWFFVFGICSIHYFTFMYLVTAIGAYILLYFLGIFTINFYYLRYILVALFPFTTLFILFSEWNDRNRIMRKGGKEVKAKYIGCDKYFRSMFEFYLDSNKYKATSNRYADQNNYSKNEKVKIVVSTENPQKIYNYPSKEYTQRLILLSIILLLFCVPIILLMMFEQ